jgi:hypothetical protein
MALDPLSIIAWVMAGSFGGVVGGKSIDGIGLGLISDLLVATAGGVIAGFLFSTVYPAAGLAFLGSMVVAFIGGFALTKAFRALPFGRTTA